jgi:hypothetical protein
VLAEEAAAKQAQERAAEAARIAKAAAEKEADRVPLPWPVLAAAAASMRARVDAEGATRAADSLAESAALHEHDAAAATNQQIPARPVAGHGILDPRVITDNQPPLSARTAVSNSAAALSAEPGGARLTVKRGRGRPWKAEVAAQADVAEEDEDGGARRKRLQQRKLKEASHFPAPSSGAGAKHFLAPSSGAGAKRGPGRPRKQPREEEEDEDGGRGKRARSTGIALSAEKPGLLTPKPGLLTPKPNLTSRSKKRTNSAEKEEGGEDEAGGAEEGGARSKRPAPTVAEVLKKAAEQAQVEAKTAAEKADGLAQVTVLTEK